MDSDIVLKDDGTAEITGDRFKASVSDIEMYYRGGHLKTANGSLELTSDSNTLKLAATNFEMYYRGGHLLTKDNGVELGSTDRGALRGFSQTKDGSVTLTGDRTTVSAASLATVHAGEVRIEGASTAKVTAPSVQLGSQVADKFFGLSLSSSALTCSVPAVSVVNPNVPKPTASQRVAMSHDAEDKLVLNVQGHYTGGVKVDGKLELADALAKGELSVSTSGKLLLLRPDRVSTVAGHTVRVPTPPLDVLQTLAALQEAVQGLTNRVAALEAKVGR